MLIANPIYGTVLKYLLEDLDIAKCLISAIIGHKVTEISLRPQEAIGETNFGSMPLVAYPLDFVAVVSKKKS